MNHTTTPVTANASVAPLRIFLVEDSVAVRDLMIDTLKEIPGVIFAGFADEEADALKKIDAESFDVLILDIELRQGNGMSLLRTLAESHKPLNSVKIIFSNNVSNAFRRAGEKYGVRFFFDKSSEFAKLRDLLTALGTGLPDH